MNDGENLPEKKLRGSGGYVFAKVTDEEQKRGNLGGPELFLAGVGRLDDDRFSKYYCNKCEKEHEGAPAINYENPNEELGEGVTLMEKGEYKCRICNNTLAQYRKFNTPHNPQSVDPSTLSQTSPQEVNKIETSSVTTTQRQFDSNTADILTSGLEGGFIPLQSFIGMPAYDSEAMHIGRIQEIGLRRSDGNTYISIRIAKNENKDTNHPQTAEISWNNISKIGDIVLLDKNIQIGTKNTNTTKSKTLGKCLSCGYQNEGTADYCEECGTKLT